MIKNSAVVITGSSGGIGTALATHFKKLGFFVIGVDQKNSAASSNTVNAFVKVDLADEKKVKQASLQIVKILRRNKLSLASLVNNAALQVVRPLEELSANDFITSYRVNVVAPSLLASKLIRDLEKSAGCVINLGSIHEKLTKKNFASYAATKAALSSLSRSMSIEWSDRVKVFHVSPAAISTPMLLSGFVDSNNLKGLKLLKKYHPTGSIGDPKDLGMLCEFLVTKAPQFMSGSTIGIDGGIAGVLHDPS